MSIKSPILVVTIGFVFADILFGRTTNIVLLTLFLLFLAFSIIHRTAPKSVPKWIPKLAAQCSNRVAERLTIFPVEALIPVGIIFLIVAPIVNIFDHEQSYDLISCLLLLVAFILTEMGSKAAANSEITDQSFVRKVIGPFCFWRRAGDGELGGMSPQDLDQTIYDATMPYEAATDGSETSKERDDLDGLDSQKERWTNWIKEEMHRLSGDPDGETE